ncbi:MAG: hypothetical protein NVS9B14_11020 [Candidatus Acidiferrum sp.]
MRKQKSGNGRKTAAKLSARWETVPTPELLAVRASGGRRFLGTSNGLWIGSIRERVLRPKGLTGGKRILDIASESDDLLVLTEDSILESRNGGDMWASLSLPTEVGKLRWLHRVPEGAPRILLGTDHGVFLGEFVEATITISWRLLQSGLPVAASRSGFVREGIWVTTTDTGTLYVSVDEGVNWNRIEGVAAGPILRVMNGSVDRLLVETKTDGVMTVGLSRLFRK